MAFKIKNGELHLALFVRNASFLLWLSYSYTVESLVLRIISISIIMFDSFGNKYYIKRKIMFLVRNGYFCVRFILILIDTIFRMSTICLYLYYHLSHFRIRGIKKIKALSNLISFVRHQFLLGNMYISEYLVYCLKFEGQGVVEPCQH